MLILLFYPWARILLYHIKMYTMKNFKKKNFAQKLEHIRRYFLLQTINFKPKVIKDKQGKLALTDYNMYINSPDHTGKLDTILIPQLEAYKDTVDELLESQERLLDIEEILIAERRAINIIIREYSFTDEFNLPVLVGYLVKRKKSKEPYHFTYDSISPDFKNYLKDHFSYRRAWLYKLNDLVEEALDRISQIKNIDLDFRMVFTKNASLNVSEIWYSLENGFFTKKYCKEEIKILRKKFFEFFGINDKDYSKSIGDIKGRARGHKAPFLKHLINIIETNFSNTTKTSFRKAQSIQKKNQKSK